ncbi:hypothetical protein LV716_00870 [Flagellimonas sp. HMM57]|uniref:lipocalin family protein n=1 Tax=unclassified Flagellimonas TaxID=2644544 RepID=UPI0013D15A17|nr:MULTISPECIES: lipocalin family protein [unclassified Flagellimonas]UII76374.1 hypothetical protein LV716_00870 [Flagellimonas sp. HMM57]
MKLYFTGPGIFLFFLILLTAACNDNFETSDVLINEINEENSIDEENGEETATDGDGEKNEEGGNTDETGDSTNDETGDETTGDENTEDQTEDENTGDETGDETTGDETGDENTGDENTASAIVGNWELVSATINDGQGSTNVENFGVVSFPFSASSKDENAQITFSENPNVVNGTGQYTIIVTYTIAGSEITDESSLESPITNGTWQQSNNDLTITGGDENIPGDFTINELTDNRMVLEVPFDRTIPVGELEVDATGTLVITLNKM